MKMKKGSCSRAEEGGTLPDPQHFFSESLERLRAKLEQENGERRRAQCMAKIQSHAVQLTLDLIVREPDPASFFRLLMKALLDQTESHACGVWLLDEDSKQCDLWMAYVGDEFYSKESGHWGSLAVARQDMATHLLAYAPGWTDTIEYTGDDPRLPDSVREFDRSIGLMSVAIVPLILPTRNLGWVALSTGDSPAEYAPWRRATLEAIARQVTLALHQSRLTEQSLAEARHQAVLEERNRIARDIHDTLAQGFAAILMQLQSVQRSASRIPPSVAKSIDAAVDLARSHMIEARRSVGALRPQDIESGDVASVLERTAELARRTTDVPIELVIEDLPPLGAGVEREIAGIAQEALTNAVRHARAHKIRVHAASTRSVGLRLSIADDGRGIAKERFGAGFGLTSMQERAERIGGSLTIVTAPRSGTEVVLAWEPPAFTIASA
ncbi:MAG TPA: GAF domain-containing sensor histidine kinase [Thermoanaerobaculia bacterium]|nr:GAF domain-containing sensor histidine kinase [Thermoanaerobaculia bacterium]